MAADQEVALKGTYPDLNIASPLTAAQNYQVGQSNLQVGQQNLQLGQTKLQMLNRVNQGEDIQFQNQLMRDAAMKGRLGPEAWDAAFQEAHRRGATGAGQMVGRYYDLLPQRVFDAYGGASAPAAGAAGGGATTGSPLSATAPTSNEQLERTFQNVPLEHKIQSLQKQNIFLGALTKVKDQQSFAQAIEEAKAGGIENAAQIFGPYYAGRAGEMWDKIKPMRDWLQNNVAMASTGVPPTPIKNDTKTVSGVEYSIDPYSGTAKPMTPPVQKPVPDTYGPNGEPVFYTEQGGLVRGTSPPGGVSIADAAARIEHKSENATVNPAATNPRSTAMGNGQFIEKTWLDTIKEARPDLAKTMNDKQLLALRADPAFSADMTTALAGQNATSLAKSGLPVTTATLALAHRFGAGDATRLLNAAPNTPMENLFPPSSANGRQVQNPVLAANPDLVGKTAGEVAQQIIRKVGNDQIATDAEGKYFHKGQFDKPQLVETDDGKGGTNRVLAQQNNRTGQWFTADEKRTPIDATNMVIIPESMGAGGGGRFAGQVIRIMNSAKQATNEIGNLVHLPLESSTGWFGGRGQGPSLFAATKEVLANTVTSQEVQDFNVSMIGMSRSLATLESGGMQTNEALVKKFEGLALKEGDTNWTKMRKLATMRQDAQASIETLLTSPLMGKKQKEFAEALIKDLASAVPWTPNDVTRLQRDKNKNATLGDYAKSAGLGTPGLVEGDIYTDAKGNRAKYKGMGRWEPVAAGAGK